MATQELTEMLDQLDDIDGNEVTMQEILKTFSHRGFGALILIPALIVLLPTGILPGVATICAIFIVLVMSQLLFGRDHPWLPEQLRNLSLPHDRVSRSVERARPVTKRIDRIIKPRLSYLDNTMSRRIVALLSMFIAITMIPLELVPFAVVIPAGLLVILSLALVADDGVVLVVGFVLTLMALWFGVAQWPWLE